MGIQTMIIMIGILGLTSFNRKETMIEFDEIFIS